MFQFPLHRDPRCNKEALSFTPDPWRFSSLYIGILAATELAHGGNYAIVVSVPFTSGSSLQQSFCSGSCPNNRVSVPFTSGSSLQPKQKKEKIHENVVSVPFTSGSSLQLEQKSDLVLNSLSFSSLYIGILAATRIGTLPHRAVYRFSSLYIGILAATENTGVAGNRYLTFQFPLHRDPRCNR